MVREREVMIHASAAQEGNEALVGEPLKPLLQEVHHVHHPDCMKFHVFLQVVLRRYDVLIFISCPCQKPHSGRRRWNQKFIEWGDRHNLPWSRHLTADDSTTYGVVHFGP